MVMKGVGEPVNRCRSTQSLWMSGRCLWHQLSVKDIRKTGCAAHQIFYTVQCQTALFIPTCSCAHRIRAREAKGKPKVGARVLTFERTDQHPRSMCSNALRQRRVLGSCSRGYLDGRAADEG